MPAERTSMRKAKEILRLAALSLSRRQVALCVRVGLGSEAFVPYTRDLLLTSRLSKMHLRQS